MNLAPCLHDWFSTRTAVKLLAGTKRLHPAWRQNPATIPLSVYSNGHRRPPGPL
jgi:hypothetical protein